jgi:hypothetical protein
MVPSLNKATLVVASSNQVSADVPSDHAAVEPASSLSSNVVILHLQDGVYFELNETGSRVWQLVQQPCRLGAIFDSLLSEYDVDSETCWDDLVALAEDMLRHGLLEIKDATDVGT